MTESTTAARPFTAASFDQFLAEGIGFQHQRVILYLIDKYRFFKLFSFRHNLCQQIIASLQQIHLKNNVAFFTKQCDIKCLSFNKIHEEMASVRQFRHEIAAGIGYFT